MNNYSYAQEGNSLFVTKNTCTEFLWTGEPAICTCAHHLIDHSRNDERGQGRCSIGGCRCNYFSPHKVKKPKCRQWEDSL